MIKDFYENPLENYLHHVVLLLIILLVVISIFTSVLAYKIMNSVVIKAMNGEQMVRITLSDALSAIDKNSFERDKLLASIVTEVCKEKEEVVTTPKEKTEPPTEAPTESAEIKLE